MTERGASQSRGARVARGLGAAVSAVVIAALSHVAGGGAAPGLLGTALALAFAVLVCIALAGRRLTAGRTTVAVTLSQFVFHVLFSLGAALPTAHGHDVSMLGMVMTGGHAATLPALGTAHVDSGLEAAGAIMWAGRGDHPLAAARRARSLLGDPHRHRAAPRHRRVRGRCGAIGLGLAAPGGTCSRRAGWPPASRRARLLPVSPGSAAGRVTLPPRMRPRQPCLLDRARSRRPRRGDGGMLAHACRASRENP